MERTGVRGLEAEAHRLRGIAPVLLAGLVPGSRFGLRAIKLSRARCASATHDRRGPAAGGSVVGIARHGQPVPAAQGAEGSAGYRLRRSFPNAGGDLRPVHRGVRNAGLARGEGAAARGQPRSIGGCGIMIPGGCGTGFCICCGCEPPRGRTGGRTASFEFCQRWSFDLRPSASSAVFFPTRWGNNSQLGFHSRWRES